ncbi:MAG: TlpA family protein disulfide reductase [Saprospiraceae bacterium]|nr:TlpA family protein disulfide reductase [Saprospiraceae bacterium]
MRYFILYLNLAVLLFQAQCQISTAASIQGNIELSPDWRPVVYLIQPRSFDELFTNYGGLVVDSAQIKPNGDFAFQTVHRSGLYLLTIQRPAQKFPNYLVLGQASANFFPLVIDAKEKLTIKAQADQFLRSTIIDKPSEPNQAMLELSKLYINTLEQAHPKEVHSDDQYLAANQLPFFKALSTFADSTKEVYAALAAIRLISPESDYERIPEFLVNQCGKWSTTTPDNPMVMQLCAKTNSSNLPVLVGDTMADFQLPSTNADTLMLKKILGKKLTILDIWASWCAPCRRENRDVLVPLWQKYQPQGLQIIGYSIDASEGAWKAAIAKDKAGWTHTSHLTGDSTPFMDALRIQTIPANFILDGSGKVVAKNLHGANLARFVDEWFSKN